VTNEEEIRGIEKCRQKTDQNRKNNKNKKSEKTRSVLTIVPRLDFLLTETVPSPASSVVSNTLSGKKLSLFDADLAFFLFIVMMIILLYR
jgi:hypothetical protein